jgi:acetoin utilization deacetylase AcuC-like enzyme
VVVRLASEFCQGRVVAVLEGGYRLDGLGESVVAHVRALEAQDGLASVSSPATKP